MSEVGRKGGREGGRSQGAFSPTATLPLSLSARVLSTFRRATIVSFPFGQAMFTTARASSPSNPLLPIRCKLWSKRLHGLLNPWFLTGWVRPPRSNGIQPNHQQTSKQRAHHPSQAQKVCTTKAKAKPRSPGIQSPTLHRLTRSGCQPALLRRPTNLERPRCRCRFRGRLCSTILKMMMQVTGWQQLDSRCLLCGVQHLEQFTNCSWALKVATFQNI